MSNGFYPLNPSMFDQANKVFQIKIAGSDGSIYQISGGNLYVMVLEPVSKVYLASVKVDSTNLVTQFAQSSLVVVDSNLLTPGGNMGAIQITGLSSLASGDCLNIDYSTN